MATACLLFVGLASIWFDDPGRLATGPDLLTAGLVFALQRVVTALAGYVVILLGRTFNVGDRIVMGGVRTVATGPLPEDRALSSTACTARPPRIADQTLNLGHEFLGRARGSEHGAGRRDRDHDQRGERE